MRGEEVGGRRTHPLPLAVGLREGGGCSLVLCSGCLHGWGFNV